MCGCINTDTPTLRETTMEKCKREECKNLVRNKRNKFCSQTCSAKVNNKGVRRHGKTSFGICLFCKTSFRYNRSNRSGTYCSAKCRCLFVRKESKDLWLAGGKNTDRSIIRRYLKEDRGNVCSISGCGLSSWMGKDITLIVDHIDGNAGNDNPDNVRLICPNCNSQTDTFSGRNKGNGRKSRGLAR